MRFSFGLPFVLFASVGSIALGQITIAPPFDLAYSLADLGSPPGVPANLGGIVFLRGNPNTLLVGGNANGGNAGIYSVPLTRGPGLHITGFAGSATYLHDAPNIDGGLAYAPNGTLFYTRYPVNALGQISQVGAVASEGLPGWLFSVGTLAFVPSGYPNAGALILASYGQSTFHSVPLSPGVSGLYNVGATTEITSPGSTVAGPEGIVYVPRLSPLFPFPSMLVSEYNIGRIRSHDVGSQGEPVAGSERDFIVGLSGAEGGVLDPLTGDFIFSTFSGGNTIIVISGFTVPACNAADVGRQGGQAVPDRLLDNNDFVVFIDRFFNTDPIADLGKQGGIPGHDQLFDNNDFVVFIDTFFSPCD